MSRQARLPPRCPFQNKDSSPRSTDSGALTAYRNDEIHRGRHFRFPSQGSVLEEQPSWLDELLNDTDTNVKGIFHRRSASDSVALFDFPAGFPSPASLPDEGRKILNESCTTGGKGGNSSVKTGKFADLVAKQGNVVENSSGLEAGCIYGPNSPRREDNLTQMECTIVSALSEYVPRRSQYFSENLPISFEIGQSDTRGDAFVHDFDPEKKATNRHSGQRSRVRKLQYIAELERTVNIFQTLESDLAAKFASLFRKHHILSIENRTLKKQITNLQAEKMIKNAEYLSLKNEIERLKMVLMKIPKGQISSYFHVDPAETGPSDAGWQMLDMRKLRLGENPISLKHGFKS